VRLRIGLPRAVVKGFGQRPREALNSALSPHKPHVTYFTSRRLNRPTYVRFGPDGCAYVADYGVVREFGQFDPDAKFKVGADAPLVQIPGTA
jgi:hypothetical protein